MLSCVNHVLSSDAGGESVLFLSYLVTLHSFRSHAHFLFLVYPDVVLVCPDNVCIYTCYDVYMCVVCVHACMRACARACVRACMYVKPDMTGLINNMSNIRIYLFLLSFDFVLRVVFYSNCFTFRFQFLFVCLFVWFLLRVDDSFLFPHSLVYACLLVYDGYHFQSLILISFRHIFILVGLLTSTTIMVWFHSCVVKLV